MAKQPENSRDGQKRRAKTVLKPRKQPSAAPTVSKPHTVDPEKVEAWRALPEEQRMALREREAARFFRNAAAKQRDGDLKEAVSLYGKSLLLNPKQADVYNNMGVALRALGNLEAAVACYRRSLALKPNNSGVFSNMGNALRELGRLEIAQASHQQAVRLAPQAPEAHYNLGLVLRDMGQAEAALDCFDKALSLDPNHVDCQWDRALTLLEMGRLEEGFEAYESRWNLARSAPRDFDQPMWDGSDLGGKSILVHYEQGFGDMIQFARYIKFIKERGGQVIVEVQPELARLMGSVEGVSRVVNRGQNIPKFDFYISMMSLAYIFGTDLETIPAAVPYVQSIEPGAVQLPPLLGGAMRVGIAWAGRKTHQNDKNRSAGFRHFIEVLGLPGISVFSLQKGEAAGDIAANGCEALVTDLSAQLRDFSDTAAVVQQLDLVITVDTALAHLAGAMGKPVWVALPFAADWRWMRNTDTSPWYPTMRLFRQKRHGAWDGVFSNIRRALGEEIIGT